MSGDGDTIVALSSGRLPAGVAVVRLSGAACRDVVSRFIADFPPVQKLVLRDFLAPCDGELIDQGLVVWFEGPRSFTGEDCAEFHLHGSQAVVARFLDECVQLEGVRLALAGEFVQRAFEAGRLDALEVEAIADLLEARTEGQRRQAVAQMVGGSSDIVLGWRTALIDLRAQIEACLDFSDEEDVPNNLPDGFERKLAELTGQVAHHLNRANIGEMVREGIVVAIVGRPNVGKSSLLNVLAARDVAIVTEEAGTTRDLLQVDLDIGGAAFQIFDTAGLRQTESVVEAEGIRRAQALIERADIVLHLDDRDDFDMTIVCDGDVWRLRTKSDLDGAVGNGEELSISSQSLAGVDELLDRLGRFAAQFDFGGELQIVTRQRHLSELKLVQESLIACSDPAIALEIRAEHLRQGSDALGRIVGLVDIEDVLDRLFAGFCIGK